MELRDANMENELFAWRANHNAESSILLNFILWRHKQASVPLFCGVAFLRHILMDVKIAVTGNL